MQELFHVLGQANAIIKCLGVTHFIVVELQQKIEGKILDFLLLFFAECLNGALELIADIITMHGLITDDETDEIGRIGKLGTARPIHRQIKARIKQEAFQKHAGDLLLQRIVRAIIIENELRLLLQELVFFRPAISVINVWRQTQCREDRRIGTRMNRFHERDVRQNGLFMWRCGIIHKLHRADGILDRVKKGQAGENADSELLLFRLQRFPRLNVVRQRHFFRQPEIAGQTVPDLKVLIVIDAVPVDSAHETRLFGRVGFELHIHWFHLGHRAQDTQPSTCVPSSAIWRKRM